MTPFEELVTEANRHLHNEAGGDPTHPGHRLRVLLLLNLSQGEQREQIWRDIREAGFMPCPDRYNPDIGGLCSLESVARALEVPASTAANEVEKFVASDIGRRLGFSWELIFPDSEKCCSLH